MINVTPIPEVILKNMPRGAAPHNVHNVDFFWLRCEGLRGIYSTKLAQGLHPASTCV